MLEVSYNFYYHLNEKFPAKEVYKIIEQHNFKEFIALYEKWGDFYLPKEAFVYADKDYEHMVTTDITIEHNFNNINSYEYECG